MHLLPMYAGMFDARQQSTEWGVGGATFGNEGLHRRPHGHRPGALRGGPLPLVLRPPPRSPQPRRSGSPRFDPNSAGTVLAMLFYPDAVDPVDPATLLPLGLHDNRGGYWFRSAWNDANDLIVSLATDTVTHGNAWDEADALQVNIMGFGSKFAGGPGTLARCPLFFFFSQVTIDGQARASQSHTGQAQFFEVDENRRAMPSRAGGKQVQRPRPEFEPPPPSWSPIPDDDETSPSSPPSTNSPRVPTAHLRLAAQRAVPSPLFTGEEGGPCPPFTLRGEARRLPSRAGIMYPAGGTLSDGNPLAYTFEGQRRRHLGGHGHGPRGRPRSPHRRPRPRRRADPRAAPHLLE